MTEEQTKSSDLASATFLVTGAHGFLGAWIVKRLLAGDARVVIFDQSSDPRRLRLIMSDGEIDRATLITGDITEADALVGLPTPLDAALFGFSVHCSVTRFE